MNTEQVSRIIQEIAVMAIPLLLAVTLHEAAHAWVADKKGDMTARQLGRITLNPWVHTDLFGTILMPLLFFVTTGSIFGYAKPVPVNSSNLRHPKQDMAWVAAAGPGMNLVLGIISGLLYRVILFFNPELFLTGAPFTPSGGIASLLLTPLLLMLRFSVDVNIVLMIFNLIPIPPLDGGRVLVGLLPRRQSHWVDRIEPYGMMILLVLVFFDPLGLMRRVIWPLVSTVSGYIFWGWAI